jgi:N-acetylmuramoyl-L-alanine amidase
MTDKLTYNDHDIDIMARTLFGEAKANDADDAKAIAWVIRNRLSYQKKRWGLSLADVCLARLQFSCWNSNDPNRKRITDASYENNAWLRRCRKIAQNVVDDIYIDPTSISTHYHTPAVKPKWSKGKQPVYITKGHKFFNDIDTSSPPKKLSHKQKVAAVTTTSVAATTAAVTTIDPSVIAEHAPTLISIVNAVKELNPFVALAVISVVSLGGLIWWKWGRR